jgi:uncharacterized OB-fold protein
MNAHTYVPEPEWLNLQWHQASVGAGVLCVQRCTDCGRWRQPPRRFCASCSSAACDFEPVSGRGRVLTFAVSHRSLDPGWAASLPLATLVVELDEGPRIIAATDLDPTNVRIGLPVELRIDPRGEDFALIWADASTTDP